MREIKLRLWDKTEEEMIYLDKVGDRQHHTFGIRKDGSLYYYNLQNGSGGDEYILMQFTGLQDIEKTKIYEDDLVKIIDYPDWEGSWRVMWDDELFMFVIEAHGDKEPLYEFDKYLIVGNVHNNPKLLESGE